MLFNSIPFLLFAVIFFAVWPIVKKSDGPKWTFIVIMSFVFYGWWDWRFLFLLIGSGLIDFFAGLMMLKQSGKKKLFLILSLVGNLGSLFIFKYSGFFASMLDDLLSAFGAEPWFQNNIPEFALILPVGISFYTFQSMSYTIDIYKGKLKPVKNIMHFFSYLSMFPQLVAGPIVRASELLPQLVGHRKVSYLQIWNGLKLIVFGFFQKTVIADNIGYLVDRAYQNKATFDGGMFWWVVIIAFAFQIYCDFSGYSLIARGLAKIMGLHFRMNFNHPYHSASMREFWTRWHISLSTWFRDYVYIPLGGSRRGFWWGIMALSTTMIVSGIWHGAAYTFIVWGALHALYSAVERITKWPKALSKIFMGRVISGVITFILVLFAWNYFRAQSMEQANTISLKLLQPDLDFSFVFRYINEVFFLALAIVIELSLLLYYLYRPIKKFYKNYSLDVVFMTLAFVACIFLRGDQAEFIYFQF